MPRWEADAVGRLETSALALFAERGYDQTTVADIAERAGLTKRTFFNHFADKAEVLFRRRSERQHEAVRRGIAAGGPVPPLDLTVEALQAAADELYEGRHDEVVHRQRVVGAHPELRERELAKRAALTGVIADALVERGLPAPDALLVARAGTLVQQTAMEHWLGGGRQPLRDLLADALRSLRAAVDAGGRPIPQLRR